jgi:signal transduction histidine kinase
LSSLNRALAMLALAALLLGLLGAALILGSDHVAHRGAAAALGFAIGAAWIGTGLYVWWRRPETRFGALMTWVGFAWLLNAFSAANSAVIFTLAVLVSNVYLAAFLHLLLAYPDGRVSNPSRRRLAAGGYALSILGPVPALMFGFNANRVECGCPSSIIDVSGNVTVGNVLDAATNAVAVGVVVYVLWVLVDRWREATPPQRRSMAPLLWSGVALMVLVAGTFSAATVTGGGDVTDVLALLSQIVFASVPFAFLLGLLRSRVVRADAVGELLLRLGEAPGTDGLRGLLADALGDRSLQLVYWIDGRWVDRKGRPAVLPPHDDPARAWTPVELEGQRVGAIVHDISLDEAPEIVGSVAAAAGLAVQNERLEAALSARLEDLRGSRARIVEAGLAERRRLERNLHDGAQQRLVALSLTLRMAQGKIHQAPDQAERMVGAAQEELTRALEELRELARGIHPAVLSDRGLQAAVEALAVRSPLPVRVVEVPGERLPEPVEAAAYFVIAEALTNVAKYADANEATVAVRRDDGHALVEVRDDGVGGADPARGSGLHGLADRVGALDGSLSLDSPPGAGTILRAQIPV